jgi:hypothetical protein
MHLIRSLGEFWNLNSHVYSNECYFIQMKNVSMSVCMILCVNNINVIFFLSKFKVSFSN